MSKRKLIVFDMDDVLWVLNKKAARMAGIPAEKLTTFNTLMNPNLTDKEKSAMLAVYNDLRLFEDIEFYEIMINLVNDLYHNYPQYETRIISNCTTAAIRECKYEQLRRKIDLPKSQIELHVIDKWAQSFEKKLPSGMFIFVDDSPYNIALSDARHRIMPPANHNNVVSGGLVNGVPAIRPDTIEAVKDLVMEYIAKDSESS